MRVKRLRPLMGTLCAIEVRGKEHLATRALKAAFEVMSDIERLLHPSRAGSDLARIAENTGKTIEVAAQTWDLLSIAQSINQSSDGLFDPCLPTQPGRLSDIELRENRQVFTRVRVALDLGGIAKGFAIDRAIESLREAGCNDAIVNAGGDARVFGDQSQDMFLRTDGQTVLQVTLRDSALAVTDIAASHAPSEHCGYYNRANSQPRVRDRAAIQASSAVVADALTKCALYSPASQLDSLLRGYRASLLDW